MNKLNYSQNNIDASTKNQKSSLNRKRPCPQDSPPPVQNFPEISVNMMNPLSQLPQNRKTGQIPILPAPAKPIKKENLENGMADTGKQILKLVGKIQTDFFFRFFRMTIKVRYNTLLFRI